MCVCVWGANVPSMLFGEGQSSPFDNWQGWIDVHPYVFRDRCPANAQGVGGLVYVLHSGLSLHSICTIVTIA